MDYIRTPYRRKCKLFKDSDEEVTLQWYEAPRGAKLFPYWHRYASGDWSPKELPVKWTGVGEIKAQKRRWWKGTPHLPYKGQCFIGPLDWYQNGVPHLAASLPIIPPPHCCVDLPEEEGVVYYSGSGAPELALEGSIGPAVVLEGSSGLEEGSGSGSGEEEGSGSYGYYYSEIYIFHKFPFPGPFGKGAPNKPGDATPYGSVLYAYYGSGSFSGEAPEVQMPPE